MPEASDTSRSVLDASVAIRWLVDEVGSTEAREVVEATPSWIAPHLLVTERASALRRKVVAAEMTSAEAFDAAEILKQAIDDGFVRLAGDRELVTAALSLALDLRHKLPDCMYLALAEREGVPLVTADRTFAGLARLRGVSCTLVPSR